MRGAISAQVGPPSFPRAVALMPPDRSIDNRVQLVNAAHARFRKGRVSSEQKVEMRIGKDGYLQNRWAFGETE